MWSIRTTPTFAIGQRAYLVHTHEGNLLWDCVALIDANTIDWARRQGGITAIAVSHPHYYATMVEWSGAFDNSPIWIHDDDRQWIVRSSDAVTYWTGDVQRLFGNLRLLRCGGHFRIIKHRNGPRDAPVKVSCLLVISRRFAWIGGGSRSWYSYPNWIPFDAETVNTITRVLHSVDFDCLYGAFGRHILENAKVNDWPIPRALSCRD